MRLIALLLAVLICVCPVPVTVFAGETAPAWDSVDKKYDIYELVTTPKNGDTLVIFNPGSGRALSSEKSGYYQAGILPDVTGEGYLAFDSDAVAWRVSLDETGIYRFAQDGLTLGVEKIGSYVNLKANAGDPGFLVTSFTPGGQLYRIRSATQETGYGFAYLEWYAGKEVFSVYATAENKAGERDFGFSFYRLVREGTAEVPVIPTEPVPPTEEPQSTEAPLPTEAPQPTDAPLPTEAPQPTDAPLPTETPQPTDAPLPTEAPQFTEPTEPTQPAQPETPVILPDGDYVIWVPAYGKALSGTYDGFYNNGVDVAPEGDTLTGYGRSEIWTVTNNPDGTITISQDSAPLAMGDSYTSMTPGEKHTAWVLEAAGGGLYYINNPVRDAYIQWYADKGYWSAYYTIGTGEEGKFALCFTPARRIYATEDTVVEDVARWGGMTRKENTAFVRGDKYVSGDEADIQNIYTTVVGDRTVTPWAKGGSTDAPLYYMGATGIGSGNNDYLQLILNAAGWGNMTLSFRLRVSNAGPGAFQLQYSSDNGASWQNFSTGSYSYAYTGWTGAGSYPVTGEGSIVDGIARTALAPGNYVNFSFDVPTGADNCENLLIRLVPGTQRAKGDGAISATSTVRLDSVALTGSPIVDRGITGFVTVTPDDRENRMLGTQLTMTSATESAAIYYRVNGGAWQTYADSAKPILDSLPCNLEVYARAEGRADSVTRLYRYTAGTVDTVKFSPNGGAIYILGEASEIALATATEGAVIYYATSADGIIFSEFTRYTGPIVVEKGFGAITIQAYAAKEGYRSSQMVTRRFTQRTSAEYQIYFGQLHAHSSISDGTGTVEEAFQYASQVENLDFLAVTDHSNSFDNESSGVLSQDGSSLSAEWKQGHEAAAAVTNKDFVGLYGYEMTWSNGLGHINTFNTPGWQSRTQSDYKNKDTALQNYYAALATVPESISQFNHPGTTFGDFSDFAHYSPEIDTLITLIEVGNGEGAIGSAGYFTAYEYYTRALDKGWHLAPTNNQDNHKGFWGDANTGRSVVLADSLTEAGIYDALRNYRVYATEDHDLRIYYTLEGHIMGSTLAETDVGETVTIQLQLSDATDSAIGRVEVIVNGGETAAARNMDASSGTLTLTVPAQYSYYYIRITQPDGDRAVTAPVWVGQMESLGISGLKAGSSLTVAGHAQTFTAELFNNESADLVVEALIYPDKATGEVLFRDMGITAVGRESTAVSSFSHSFPRDGVYTITATLKGTLNGIPKTYTKELTLTVMPENMTNQIIVDGTHDNDYVTGYYGGSMNNAAAIAADRGIQFHVEQNQITPEMLENCALLIISAPARKPGTGNAGDYMAKPFEDSFIQMVADYVRSGGSVVICGLADYHDKGATYGDTGHAAAQLNNLLTALDSTLRFHDDEAYDETYNGGQTYRLYPKNFNTASPWCAGIITGENGQAYSQYSGCTVDPGSGTWLVRGFDTTYSIDSDGDGFGGVKQNEAVFLAVEDTIFGGHIFAAGGVFLSDYEIKAEMDSVWDLPYANQTIFENILGITRQNPEVAPIGQVRASAEAGLGRIFLVEGYVTAGTDNDFTTFFDTIYIQDETGGIALFSYDRKGLTLGTKVRVTGCTDVYQGDLEMNTLSLEILEESSQVIDPESASARDAMDYSANGGSLLQVAGEVVAVTPAADGMGVAQFDLRDEAGDTATVFIDGYIRSGSTGENNLARIVRVGNTVSAVGLSYMHPEGDSEGCVTVLRVRNCDEVLLICEKPAEPKVDTSLLEKAMENAAARKQKDYSPKTWSALQTALKAARSTLEDTYASQEEIDAALDSLNRAIQSLAPPAISPETADRTRPGLYLTVLAASLGAAAVLLRYRKRFTA